MTDKRPIDVIIGKNLLEMRKQYGLTQSQVGEAAGINRSTYKQYENGYRTIPLQVLRDLSRFYKVPYNHFLKTEEDIDLDTQKNLMQYSNSLPNEQKYIAVVDPKQLKKEVSKINQKAQARASFRIKQLRIENNKSQLDLANMLGVSVSTYNKYEKGTRKLSVTNAQKIANYYNVKIEDLVD